MNVESQETLEVSKDVVDQLHGMVHQGESQGTRVSGPPNPTNPEPNDQLV